MLTNQEQKEYTQSHRNCGGECFLNHPDKINLTQFKKELYREFNYFLSNYTNDTELKFVEDWFEDFAEFTEMDKRCKD